MQQINIVFQEGRNLILREHSAVSITCLRNIFKKHRCVSVYESVSEVYIRKIQISLRFLGLECYRKYDDDENNQYSKTDK